MHEDEANDRYDLSDLTPEERRLLRSRWLRDTAGGASDVGTRLAGCALSLLLSFGSIVIMVWLALRVLR